MVFAGVQGYALCLQLRLYLVVARQGLGLVIVGSKHRLSPKAGSQLRNVLCRLAVQHDQAGGGPLGVQPECLVQLHQAGLNKFHPPVGPGQGVQNVGVKHKHTVHGAALRERLVQCRVVAQAQIATKPHQSDGVLGFRSLGGGGRHVHR